MHNWTWGSLWEMGVMERLWDPLRVSGIFRDLSLPSQLCQVAVMLALVGGT